MKKFFTALLLIMSVSAQSAELSSFKKIECLSADEKISHTIWPVTFNTNQHQFILSGFYMAGGLTEEIENGGVPVFFKVTTPNLSYEILKKQHYADETVFVLNAPGQYFKADQNIVLRTKDFKTGILSKGQFDMTSIIYPTTWMAKVELLCTFK